jgi:peroxidase
VSAPTITAPSKSMTVDLGQTVMFSCAAEGLPRPTITWYRISGALPSGHHVFYNNGSLVVTEVRNGDEGIYACLAKNVLGEAKAFMSFNIICKYTLI